MTVRPLHWLFRLANVLAFTGILVGPQAMVAAACATPAKAEHHQSHHGHRPVMPQHCCDLCSVACSGIARLDTKGSPVLPQAHTLLARHGFESRTDVVVSIRFLHPLAIGPPATHA